MKKLPTCIIIILTALLSHGQTGLYKTYDDFVSGKMDKMEDVQVSAFGLKVHYKFTLPGGATVSYTPKEFWGFVFKGNLFRSVRGLTAMLQDSGKVCYYLNGEAATDMIHYGRNTALTMSSYSASCYLSSGDINSKMYAMIFKPFEKDAYFRFRKDYPDLGELLDCIHKPVSSNDYLEVRECVKDYNKRK